MISHDELRFWMRFAVALNIVGTTLLAFRIGLPVWAFMTLLPGSFLLTVMMIWKNNKALAGQFAYYTFLNIVGIVRWFN